MKIKSLIFTALLAALSTISYAAGPAAGATGTATCKDGTSYTGVKKGACKGHKGVKSWDTAAAGATAGAGAAAAEPAASPKKASKAAAMPAAAAAGGGAGKVWVNTSSKTYHCEGDKYYGKTKAGQYMTEAEAKAAGDHPSHGKVCSK
ncbi:MAG: DUF3761 domain-containing protein [Rhodoferax sp.]